MMKNRTKRPPSYYKYKVEHPTVSFILNRELKEALDILKENKSYGQTMKQIIEGKVNQELSKKIKEMQSEVLRLNEQLEYREELSDLPYHVESADNPCTFQAVLTSGIQKYFLYSEKHL